MKRLCILALLTMTPWACPAEEQIHRVKKGQPAPVEGWVYPLSEHSRIIADFKAFDVALDGYIDEVAEAHALLDDAQETIEVLQDVEADLTGQLIAAELLEERARSDGRRHALYWGIGCGLSVALPWAGAELSIIDRPTAITAAVTGLSAAALIAWLTGG